MDSTKALMEPELDDDGRIKRTGNVLTASTHIVTVVVGAGVLALAWALAQLGWIAGIGIILAFSSISIFTYNLVADCYRFPDPVTGKRNYTYIQAVKAYLGGTMHVLCGLIQYGKLAGLTVGYTITSSTSLIFRCVLEIDTSWWFLPYAAAAERIEPGGWYLQRDSKAQVKLCTSRVYTMSDKFLAEVNKSGIYRG